MHNLINFFYCDTLEELYNNYNIVIKQIDHWNEYLTLFFYKSRNKIIRDLFFNTKYKNLNEFNDFFYKLKNNLNSVYNIHNTNANTNNFIDINKEKEREFEILKISQDEYLTKYYNIVLKKNNWTN